MGNSQNCQNKIRPPFKLFDLQQQLQSAQNTLKILSFNLLADCYLTKFPYKMITYYVNSKFKQLDYRMNQILDIIKELDSDIMGLQEIDFQNEKLFEKLEEYQYSYVKKQKQQFGKDFAAIAWKKNRFELIESEAWLGTDKIHPKYQNESEFAKSWGVMLFAKLLDKLTGKTFLVINGHYYFYAVFTKKHVQCSEMAQVLQTLYKHIQTGKENVIIVGDFNAPPGSISLEYLIKHHEKQFLEKLDKSDKSLKQKLLDFNNYFFPQLQDQEKTINLQSGYQDYIDKFKQPAYTIYKKFYTSTLDYIFYNDKSEIQPIRCLQKPTFEELKQFGGLLPNEFYPSDHIPLLVEFVIKE